MSLRRLLLSCSILIGLAVFALPALAEEFIHKHVRLKTSKGRKVVGLVVVEEEDSITIEIGKGATNAFSRTDIESVESIEPAWQEIEKKKAAAKTGDDWFAIAIALEKEGFDKAAYRFALDKAIAVDPNNKKAQEKAGMVPRTDAQGNVHWFSPAQAKKFDETSGDLKAVEEEMGDRPWDEFKIVIDAPKDKPQYEVITNCPKRVGEDYANFMVELRSHLTELIEKKIGVKQIPWQKSPCTSCNGSGKDGTDICKHCGGRGEEPCKIFICNSHKHFMDVTGKAENLGGFYQPAHFGPAECARPIVCFHGTFGLGDNTYGVLAHEGTHQLEHLMWKGDAKAMFDRPGWLVEGLAVYFGDGLDQRKRKQGKFEIIVPRDRLAGLRRELAQGPGHYYPIKMFTSLDYGGFSQVGPSLYAYSWSLIYYMLNTTDKLTFKGKQIDLKEAFAKFFLDNCEKGAVGEFGGRKAHLGLARAMGVTGEAEAGEVLDEMEKGWRDYVVKLPLAAVGEFDAKDKKKYISKDLGFEVTLPGGKKKAKHEWTLMAPEDLVSLPPLDEAAGLKAGGGAGRVVVCVGANAENFELEPAIDHEMPWIGRTKFEGFPASLDDLETDPVEGTLPGSGLATRTIAFEGKECKLPGYIDNPRGLQKGKVLFVRTAARIYRVMVFCDTDQWDEYKEELEEILQSFAVTGS